jgi:hypothetical protein
MPAAPPVTRTDLPSKRFRPSRFADAIGFKLASPQLVVIYFGLIIRPLDHRVKLLNICGIDQAMTDNSTREGVDLSLIPVIATLSRVADVIKEALQPRTEQLIMAFIYGSVAKAEDTANSDIEVMVISDELAYAEVMELLFANDIDGIFSTH